MTTARQPIWILALVVGLASAIAPLAASARAAQSPASLAAAVQMDVSVGFAGYFRPDSWVPVRVRISNAGPTFAGTLSMSDPGSSSASAMPSSRVEYQRSVVMPQGGVKDYTLYLPGVDLSNRPSISVVLSAGGQGSLTRTPSFVPVPQGALVVGTVSSRADLFTQLRVLGDGPTGAQPVIVPLSARMLDVQPLALATLDAVVLDDFQTSQLSGGQLDALDAWVRAGGTLVTLGGPTAQSTLSGLPADLTLVQPSLLRTPAVIPSLVKMGGPLPAGQIVAASGPVLAGTVLLDTQRVRDLGSRAGPGAAPLIVQRSLGLGAVAYSAIDPTLSPLATWSGLRAYWALLAGQARSGAATATSSIAGTQVDVSPLGDEIDSATPPSITLFVLLLGIYVLGLLPLNFVILHRLRRSDLSWLTLPALAIILVVSAFGGVYFSRGRDTRANLISVLYLTSGTRRAAIQSYQGLLSPQAGGYSITPADPATLGTALFAASVNGSSSPSLPTDDLVFAQDTGQAGLPNMGIWSSRTAMFTGLTSYQGGLTGTLRLTARGHLMGVLANHSGATLHGLVLAPYGGQLTPYGDLRPGGTIQVDLPTGSGTGTSANPQAPGDLYGALSQPAGAESGDPIPTSPGETAGTRFHNILQAVFGSRSAALFGSVVALSFTNQPISAFTVNGGHPPRQDTNLLVQTIPLALRSGPVAIAPGMIPARLAGSQQDLEVGDNSNGFSITSNSAATFVAQVPVPTDPRQMLRVSSLHLTVLFGGAGGSLTSQTAQLYDWANGRWVHVDISSGDLVLQHPQRFINAAGSVRIRLNAQDASLAIQDANDDVTLGMTGEVL